MKYAPTSYNRDSGIAGRDTIRVALCANVKPDRIHLRWAAGSPAAWRYANQQKRQHGHIRLTVLPAKPLSGR
jgi:hypothetical protein